MTVEDRDNFGLVDGETAWAIRHQAVFKALLGNGVIMKGDITSTSLKVSEKGTPDNSVDVAAGRCHIDGDIHTESSTTNVALTAAHATLDRYDLIIYDDSGGTPAKVDGTASADPQVPDVSDDNDIPLAVVYVENQAGGGYDGKIYDGDITDVRAPVLFRERCKVFDASNQSLSNNVWTDIAFDSEDFDSDSMHDTVTNNDRISITKDGIYLINGQVKFDINGTNSRGLRINRSGAEILCEVTTDANLIGTYYHYLNGSVIKDLVDGDYIELQGFQDSGGALNVIGGINYTYLEVVEVSKHN